MLEKTIIKKLTFTFLLLSTLFSCNENIEEKKFLGKWMKAKDPGVYFIIRKVEKNLVFEYHYYTSDHVSSVKKMPGFYDAPKDKIVIKLDGVDIDGIYDKGDNEIIFEVFGYFKKVE